MAYGLVVPVLISPGDLGEGAPRLHLMQSPATSAANPNLQFRVAGTWGRSVLVSKLSQGYQWAVPVEGHLEMGHLRMMAVHDTNWVACGQPEQASWKKCLGSRD